MIVSVRLFARVKDLAQREVISVPLPEGATVADLRKQLLIEIPALEKLLDHSALAVDEEFADDDTKLHADSIVALLPPVSGGQ